MVLLALILKNFLLKSVVSNKLCFVFQSKHIKKCICSLSPVSFKKAPDHAYIRKHFLKTKQ